MPLSQSIRTSWNDLETTNKSASCPERRVHGSSRGIERHAHGCQGKAIGKMRCAKTRLDSRKHYAPVLTTGLWYCQRPTHSRRASYRGWAPRSGLGHRSCKMKLSDTSEVFELVADPGCDSGLWLPDEGFDGIIRISMVCCCRHPSNPDHQRQQW